MSLNLAQSLARLSQMPWDRLAGPRLASSYPLSSLRVDGLLWRELPEVDLEGSSSLPELAVAIEVQLQLLGARCSAVLAVEARLGVHLLLLLLASEPLEESWPGIVHAPARLELSLHRRS